MTVVVAEFNDGRRVDDDVVSNGAPRVWALPLPMGVKVPGAPPIFYVAADGTELAKEHGMKIDDEARYLAFTSLTTESQRQRSYPTPAEARQIIAAAWNLEQ